MNQSMATIQIPETHAIQRGSAEAVLDKRAPSVEQRGDDEGDRAVSVDRPHESAHQVVFQPGDCLVRLHESVVEQRCEVDTTHQHNDEEQDRKGSRVREWIEERRAEGLVQWPLCPECDPLETAKADPDPFGPGRLNAFAIGVRQKPGECSQASPGADRDHGGKLGDVSWAFVSCSYSCGP